MSLDHFLGLHIYLCWWSFILCVYSNQSLRSLTFSLKNFLQYFLGGLLATNSLVFVTCDCFISPSFLKKIVLLYTGFWSRVISFEYFKCVIQLPPVLFLLRSQLLILLGSLINDSSFSSCYCQDFLPLDFSIFIRMCL